MCGIVGILRARANSDGDELAELAHSMADELIARGPDSAGHWADATAGIALGHRRLAIVDTSTNGAQPMTCASGRYVISFNGEIYNHREIADDLRSAGVRFVGHCDTEILVEAIDRWGLATTLGRVDGMFAFGLWDRTERCLTLARDRIGEKPLYYGTLPNGDVVFGSTLDALRRHPAFDLPIDRDALGLFFRHSYVPAPWSIYSGISKLLPGSTVTVSGDGNVGEPVPYWSLVEIANRQERFVGDERSAVDELDRLIRQSVQRRLIADVPVGAFLSGGIDSTTIVATAQAVSSVPIRTFTIGSTVGDFDESTAARTIAQHLGTEHSELIVTDSDALALVGSLAGIHDEPFADSSQIPVRIVSQMARESVTVALSGDGGDELFGGYNRYMWASSIWSTIKRVPVSGRRYGARAARRFPQSGWDRMATYLPDGRRPQQLGLKISKVLDVVDATSGEEVFHRLTSDWLDPEALVHEATEPLTIHTDPRMWPNVATLEEHMMILDSLTFLPDDILAKVDRAAMSVSLETRLPYLDREIVEFALRLPVSMKIRDGQSKRVLRQVLSRYVPDRLVKRPKAGFGLPIDSWLRGPLKQWAADLISESTAVGMLDAELIARTWDDHISGRRNNAYLLWDVLMFIDWCQHRGISGLGELVSSDA